MNAPEISRSLDEKQEPLAASAPKRRTNGLNATLNTEYIDVAADDTSMHARVTRSVARGVGYCCSPRQMLIILRVLKAITFAMLVCTLIADLMYIFFVELRASAEVNAKVGGTRDVIIRIYGLIMTVVALSIELDMIQYVKHFVGLRSFIPRALLLFFIATITSSHPLHEDYKGRQNNDDGGDDDAYYDEQANDYSDQSVSLEIPTSTVVFQMVTSLVLGGCGMVYLILGLLCFDRFRSKAFLSFHDPVSTTAIPASSQAPMQQPDDYVAATDQP